MHVGCVTPKSTAASILNNITATWMQLPEVKRNSVKKLSCLNIKIIILLKTYFVQCFNIFFAFFNNKPILLAHKRKLEVLIGR